MLITTLEKYILGLLNEYIVIHELSFCSHFGKGRQNNWHEKL